MHNSRWCQEISLIISCIVAHYDSHWTLLLANAKSSWAECFKSQSTAHFLVPLENIGQTKHCSWQKKFSDENLPSKSNSETHTWILQTPNVARYWFVCCYPNHAEHARKWEESIAFANETGWTFRRRKKAKTVSLLWDFDIWNRNHLERNQLLTDQSWEQCHRANAHAKNELNSNCDQSFEKFQTVHSTLTMNLNDAAELLLQKPHVWIKSRNTWRVKTTNVVKILMCLLLSESRRTRAKSGRGHCKWNGLKVWNM